MKQIDIRFLKQGLLTIEVPDDATVEQMQELGKQALDECSDQDLFMSMSDCPPCGANPTRFDADSFRVEAIQENFGESTLYSTTLWDVYAAGDFVIPYESLNLEQLHNVAMEYNNYIMEFDYYNGQPVCIVEFYEYEYQELLKCLI